MSGEGIAAVIFDMDGVMFDTERLALEAWLAAGSAFGYRIRTETVVAMIGLTGADSERVMREAMGARFPYAQVRQERLRIAKERIANGGAPMKSGLLQALTHFSSHGLKLAVATSSSRAHIELLFAGTTLPSCFDAVVSGDEVARRKPAPDIFVEAARRLGCGMPECLVIEDSDTGITAAHRAGMRVVFVRDIKPLPPALVPLVDGRFESLGEVVAGFGKLCG